MGSAGLVTPVTRVLCLYLNSPVTINTGMDYLGCIYSLFLVAGGVLGYVKAGSMMSLVMGSLTGLGAGLGAYRASQHPDQVYVGLIVSLIVAARFGQAFIKNGQIMPGGLVLVFSLVMVCKYGVRLLG